MKLTSTSIFSILFLLLLMTGISFLTFNASGYLKMHKLQTDISQLNMRIDSLRKENNILKGMNDSLATGKLKKIERTAREKYGMHKPTEVVISIDEK